MPKICRDKSNLIIVQDKITNTILTDVAVFFPMLDKDDYEALRHICNHAELTSFIEECKRYWDDVEDGTPKRSHDNSKEA